MVNMYNNQNNNQINMNIFLHLTTYINLHHITNKINKGKDGFNNQLVLFHK